MRIAQIIAAAWLMLLPGLTAPAHAEKRVALVVGNGAYLHADKLANPVSDARGMRDALAALKFDVVYGEDADHSGLLRLIGQFASRVENADVALVYFAGHGATFGDVPYVVPVDAEFASLSEMPYQLVAVETLIGELRQAKGVRIAILDACRDNGAEQELKRQASRGGAVTRGLAPMKNPSGLIIAYATQYLATAADDAGGASTGGLFSWGRSSPGHSPFTAALLANIGTPGLDVTDMFRKVGREVDAATGGKQRPEISISMYEQYALAPSAVASPPVGRPGGSMAADAERGASAERAWSLIQNTASLTVLDDYIARYGDVPIYGPRARERREEVVKLAKVVTPPPAPPARAPAPPPRSDAPLTDMQERGLKPKDTFRECADCPEMVMVPPGSFTMGSADRNGNDDPQHIVTISQPIAVGKLHVTVDQFGAFVRATGYEASSKCYKWGSTTTFDGSWRYPGFAQEGSHPVVCVSWNDANAYVEWLARKTGKPYRLLSEAEWEYAAHGRTSPGNYPLFWFGNEASDLCRNGNGPDRDARDNAAIQKSREKVGVTRSWTVAPCNDGYAYTSPAGHYTPNAFGLYDMAGNADQWTADCWHGSYIGAPGDGSAWTTTCDSGSYHVIRGGGWSSDDPWSLGAAMRRQGVSECSYIGFRVARTLGP